MTANEQERDTDRLIAYMSQMVRDREIIGEAETMAIHVRWCPGGLCCWPESLERESDI